MRQRLSSAIPLFQSTPSVWRETSPSYVVALGASPISIHSLRVEGDLWITAQKLKQDDFNPLPPCGGRPGRPTMHYSALPISIHSLRVEGDIFIYV